MDEKNRNISQGHQGKPHSAEHTANIARALRAHTRTPEHSRNLAHALAMQAKTPEGRKARSRWMKRFWTEADTEKRQEIESRIIAGAHRSLLRRPRNPAEGLMAELLLSAGIPFREQVSIGRYLVDFLIPSRATVIEIDGKWHGHSVILEHDRRRDDWISSQGYLVMRFKCGKKFSTVSPREQWLTQLAVCLASTVEMIP